MKSIQLRAVAATPALLDDLEKRGLLRRLRPSAKALATAENDQVVEQVELARAESGPWQMLLVACNRSRLTYLASHSDIESWLFFAEPRSKPLLYIVATCPADEFRQKAEAGTLAADDFLALEIRPNDPHTSYFTVPAGVLHDELTYPGDGLAPIFWVPEPSEMQHTRVPLDGYDIRVTPANR